MGKIRIYRIQLDYIKYLWAADNKVQYNPFRPDSYTEKRPYIGVVLDIGAYKYFAPLEHPREEHKTLKNNIFIEKIEDGRFGLIAINNMIPVPDECLIAFDINNEKAQYRKILLSQFIYCDKNKKTIFDKASKTYNAVVTNNNHFFNRVCCNYSALEQLCDAYKFT